MQEVHKYETSLLLDYRFSRRLAEECEADAFQLCRDVCDIFSGNPCEGAVLACLLHHQAELLQNGCASEVARFSEVKVRVLALEGCVVHTIIQLAPCSKSE